MEQQAWHAQDPGTLAAFFEGVPAYRIKQVSHWLYERGVHSFLEMSDLPIALRQKLHETFQLPILKCIKEENSSDCETTKFLLELNDKALIESVLIRAPGRRTACVSSQVGCPARCAFCASGKGGFKRNLSAAEIFEQALLIDHALMKVNERLTHIVFMGMGEPLENYGEVVRAIRMLTDPERLGISQRRITVSTVGVVENILRLADEGLKVQLALSLHAPTQDLRKRLIPYARRYPLEQILNAAQCYAEKTGRDLTYEYTLMAGINDKLEQANALVELLRDRRGTVNLIPYNPVEGLRLERPKQEAVHAFRKRLQDAGIPTTWRYTKGDDIAAACGQLALRESL